MPKLRRSDRAVAYAALGFVAVLASTCSPAKPADETGAARPVSAMPPPQQLWGEMTPALSVKELMRDLIDPLSDNIFDSVSITVSEKGVVEREPKTDDEWNTVRIGAVTMIETADLLKVPRPFAPPGDNNNSEGPDAPEISPAAIKAKLERDPVLWQAKVQAMRNAGLAVLQIVEKKDAPALWDAGEALDNACEGCHLEFWYPGQKELFEKLRLAEKR